MKKIMVLFILIVCSLSFILTGCSKEEELVLRVYNWQDYIDDGLDSDYDMGVVEAFEEWYFEEYGKEVTVIYDTFETNEVMLNTLKTGKTSYDLVCPSEYAILKMMRLGMLEEYDYEMLDENNNVIMSNYTNVSKYIRELFDEKDLSKYAVPYMWGTLGFIYNPEEVSEEEVKSWDCLWTTTAKASAKDSVRDTYVIGVMHYYQETLNDLREKMLNGEITKEFYTSEVGRLMNDCSDETIKAVQDELIEMKKNIYSFEVDSGKNDIVTGKIDLNFAWSGDAVYSMDIAEEEGEVYLNYSVPEEGSNVWFDGWVMPKGANVALAQSFVNFLCDEDIAIQNMDYIGYTSSVVGDAVLERIEDYYGPEEGEEGVEVDLTYLFEGNISEDLINEDGRIIVTINERGRQFDAQYPDEDVIMRCGIMDDFGDQNDKVLAMWENIKVGDIPSWITIFVVVCIILIIVAMYLIKLNKMLIKKRRKEKFRTE